MGIPLSEILDGGTGSMREQAATNNLPYEPFTMRELITPQYDIGFGPAPERDDEVDVKRYDGKEWENWVGQHEGKRTVLFPESRKELVAAVAKMVRDGDEDGGKVRAVGSGHSHSDVSAPGGTYIELSPGDPVGQDPDGLNDVLEHNWLKEGQALKDAVFHDTRGPRPSASEEPPTNGTDAAHLKRVEAGMILRRLNRHVLHPDGLALENMGSFDGQTIAGAVNTSTHGTGVGLSSISDSVTSVEIATVPESESGDPIVRMYRIEPDDGMTDRDAFEANTGDHEMELIQDDDIFHSVVVGYGCMGVVYAYTLRTVDNYWLREETQLMGWGTLREKLEEAYLGGGEFIHKNGARHCQIYINTATTQLDIEDANKVREHKSNDDDHGVLKNQQHETFGFPLCMIKRFVPVDPQEEMPDDWLNTTKEFGLKDGRWPPERRASPFQDAGQDLLKYHPMDYQPGKSKQLHNNFFHPGINKDPFVGGKHEFAWYVALRRPRDEGASGFVDVTKEEYYQPEPPNPPTLTTEIGVGTGNTVEFLDAFLNLLESDEITINDGEENRDIYFYAPIGIRFTAPSDHYLSPEHDRTTTMVELPLPLPQKGGSVGGLKPAVPKIDFDTMREAVVEPSLGQVEWILRKEKSDLNPRPHMGKTHTFFQAEDLDKKYEYFDAADSEDVETGWYQAYQRFNAFGTFDNKFTDGLRMDEFTPGQSTDTPGTPEPTQATGTPEPTEETGTPSEAEDDDGTVGGEVPGFGFLAGLAGLGTGAWLHQRGPGDDGSAETGEGTGETAGDEVADVDGESDAGADPDDQPTRGTGGRGGEAHDDG